MSSKRTPYKSKCIHIRNHNCWKELFEGSHARDCKLHTWCTCHAAHSCRLTCLQWKRKRNINWYLVKAFLDMTSDKGHRTWNPQNEISSWSQWYSEKYYEQTYEFEKIHDEKSCKSTDVEQETEWRNRTQKRTHLVTQSKRFKACDAHWFF